MGLGLVEGVSNLSGAPPSSNNQDKNNPLSQFTTGAKSLISDVGDRFDDLRRKVVNDGVEEDIELAESGGFVQELKGVFDLNWMQRLAIFAMTFGAGVLLIVLSFTFVPIIVLKPHKFAVAFTVGNFLAIAR